MAKPSAKVRKMLKAMEAVARVTSVMVDGDEAGRIMEGDTVHYLAHPDPEHQYLAMDHFVVDHAPFLRMKKTLARLALLLDFPCSTCLWTPIEGLDGHVTPLVQNGATSRFYEFAMQRLALHGDMAACLKTGEVVVTPGEDPSDTLTVLAPVFDSLGDAAGVVELSAKNPVARPLAPAWA